MSRLAIPWSSEPDLTRLGPVGQLTHTTAPVLGRAITKALLSTHRTLVDLDDLKLAHPSRTAVFATALADAGGWPRARLVLYGGSPATVRALVLSSVTRTVPHAATATGALAQLDVLPPLVRRRAFLAQLPSAPMLARDLVAEACTSWHIPEDTTYWAQVVVSELVTNGIEHARTDCHVVVEFTGSDLRLAVRDGSDSTPVEQDRDVSAERGRGLQVVAELTQERWGVTRSDGHKTTWAIIRTTPQTGDSPFPVHAS